METAAHTTHRLYKEAELNPDDRYAVDTSAPDVAKVINWVRVYKNPKTTSATELTTTRNLFNLAAWPLWSPPGVDTAESILLPSMNWEGLTPMWNPRTALWVNFKSADDGGALIDTGENSGLVTETENTTVKPGDRVAIAVNFNTWVGYAQPDMTIGPRQNIRYTNTNPSGDPFYSTNVEGPWRLNPNLYPRADTAGIKHTLVYQFVVDPEHAILNAEGAWLKQDFVTEGKGSDDFAEDDEPAYFQWRKNYTWTDNGGSKHPTPDLQVTGVDWVYGGENEVWDRRPDAADFRDGAPPLNKSATLNPRWVKYDDTPPSSTTVKPWNTTLAASVDQVEWGGKVDATPTRRNNNAWLSHRRGDNSDQTPSHRHVPMYDPANPPDPATGGPIFYPKVVVGNTDMTTVSTATAITNVPTGTQTGAFQVTLGFSEVQEIADFTVSRILHSNRGTGVPEDVPVSGASVSIFVAHNVSDVDTFKEKLTAALASADPPWTVTALTYAGGIELASSGKEGPRPHGTATRYTLTLSPPLGVKGDIALQIPAGVVSDAAGTPNVASEAVTVSVDTSLRLAAGAAVEIVEPESGTYLGGDALEVRVPFAADGLTYEGDAPPYITIYLGERTSANARHATWQRGEETSGSTIVPFVYVVNTDDPIASSVLLPDAFGISMPEGTMLRSGSRLSRVGKADPPKDSGEAAPAPPPSDDAGSEQVVLATDAGAPLPETEAPVNVLPVVLLPSEESEPKAAASSVPRTPIVFNELGNGSGADNDWLELRNVTDAAVSLKDWELSVVADAKQEDTSLVVFPDVSVPANGLLLLTNMPSDKTPLAGGDDVAAAGSDKRRKGLTHLSLVDAALSLPDDGKFLLILRNAKEKRGLNEAFVDVAGGGGSGTDAFIREQTGLYDTHVWPLQVLESPGSDTEDSLSAGKVWLRAKADIVGYHRDAWAEAAFSGLGYDRKVSKSAETAGTPGYPNGAVKTQPATPKGAVTMSEVMFDSAGGTLPQWIELYNTSKTEALNLNRWELEIQNRKSEDLVGRPIVTLTLQEKLIQPNQTLLIVTGNARASSADVFPADRVYNLIELHEKNLRIKTPRDTFLSVEGFYLKLTDTNGHLVDEIGNTDGDRRTDDTPAWALPVPLSEVEGMRSSLVRRYDNGVARDGTSRAGWALAANFAKFKADGLHYGHADDIGTPGYRKGGALPVELSSFTLTRTESGAVVITWTTESEVDNAGFNLRRSLKRDSGYTLLNPALIAGAGTTGERQTYTFIDTSAKPGVEHYYQIEEVSFGGKPEMLMTRRLRGPVSPAHRALTTFGEVKQAK